MDECDAINAENCVLKDGVPSWKRKKREYLNEIPISKKLEIEEKTHTLCQELDQLKDFMNIREKEFSELKSESPDLKRRLDSLVSENNKLHE